MITEDANRAGAAGCLSVPSHPPVIGGVAPTTAMLREILEGVDSRALALVDGEVRPRTDVVGALVPCAATVAIGSPGPLCPRRGRPGNDRHLAQDTR